MTKVETRNAILKGLGRRPTKYLFRWTPTWKDPFHFDLQEVFRCEADGEVITPATKQLSLRLHAGHRIRDPQRYSIFEFLMVQLRIIR